MGSAENKSSDSQSQELSGNVLAWAAGAEEEDVSQSSECTRLNNCCLCCLMHIGSR